MLKHGRTNRAEMLPQLRQHLFPGLARHSGIYSHLRFVCFPSRWTPAEVRNSKTKEYNEVHANEMLRLC